MKKKATLIIALAAAFSCTAAFAGPADSSRWTIDGDYAIRWDIGNDIPHYDHIEMSGEQVSVVYRYGVNEDGSFSMDRSVVWPMLRTVPNDTHASLTVHFDTDFMSGVTVDGKALEGEKVRSITLDGIMSVLSTYGNAPVEVTECYFPSPTRAAVCERYTITNTGDNEISVFVPAVRNVTETDPEAGTEGSYTLIASTGSGIDRSYRIAPGESISFGATIRGLKQPQMEIPIDVDREKAEREDFVKTICGELVLESPDPVLNTMFGFSKIRGAESIFATRGGLMQCPGGEAYYAAIWCNDQAEYINPFFPFLGYDKGNESAVNSFLHFAAYMNPDFNFIPWSVIAEGYESHGPFDRGDAAMLAYGASRYALAMGDLQIAETLMPLIDWSLEYCSRKINSEGVVASDADELELRFPAGEANLCTSSLYYDALRSTAWLIETMADEYAADGKSAESSAAADEAASRAAELRERAATLKGNIEKYFYSGEISIQTFSDILRCQLLSKRGGFWFDSTLFVINKNFIHEHKDLSYWSIKHSANDLLLKQKWNEYFTKGLWSIYGCGAGKDNPLFSFIYDMYLSYFELYNISFDYFQTDYTWLFAYTHFDWAKELVDNITPCVSCSYYIGQHLKKVFNKSNWDMILRENSFQKLNWRIECKKSKKQTYYDYFINSYQNND